jgi:hypothetical protein
VVERTRQADREAAVTPAEAWIRLVREVLSELREVMNA